MMENGKSKKQSEDDIEIIQEPVTQTYRRSDNFILMLRGPTLDIKKMKGHYRKFVAWKIQWNAYLISSGLGRLQKQHQQNDTKKEDKDELSTNSENHVLSALYSVMTLDTLEVVCNMNEVKQKKKINSEFVIDAIENLIANSDPLG